jgi:hypothetical protein
MYSDVGNSLYCSKRYNKTSYETVLKIHEKRTGTGEELNELLI